MTGKLLSLLNRTNVDLSQSVSINPLYITFINHIILVTAKIFFIGGLILLSSVLLMNYLTKRFESVTTDEQKVKIIRLLGISSLVFGLFMFGLSWL
jgi:uncharacterized membrane protein YdcZ (DUF606 family)